MAASGAAEFAAACSLYDKLLVPLMATAVGCAINCIHICRDERPQVLIAAGAKPFQGMNARPLERL